MKEHRLIGVFAIVILGLCIAGAAQAQAWDTNNLSWDAPTSCSTGEPISACPVTSYRIERSATATGTFSTLGTSTTTSYTHTGALAGNNCYRVIAISATGDSVPSNVACKVNTKPAGPPNPPTNLKVVSPIAYNVRPDYGRFVFVRGTRAGIVKLGAACDETRKTEDGFYAVSRRNMVTPRPDPNVVIVAQCA